MDAMSVDTAWPAGPHFAAPLLRAPVDAREFGMPMGGPGLLAAFTCTCAHREVRIWFDVLSTSRGTYS